MVADRAVAPLLVAIELIQRLVPACSADIDDVIVNPLAPSSASTMWRRPFARRRLRRKVDQR
jgi:hypothetical protein